MEKQGWVAPSGSQRPHPGRGASRMWVAWSGPLGALPRLSTTLDLLFPGSSTASFQAALYLSAFTHPAVLSACDKLTQQLLIRALTTCQGGSGCWTVAPVCVTSAQGRPGGWAPGSGSLLCSLACTAEEGVKGGQTSTPPAQSERGSRAMTPGCRAALLAKEPETSYPQGFLPSVDGSP
ncbi:hypothetical protein HJG60_010724 [Phyllostomus discolor]|uniref:Uncharacterized protein n=1 Tax=Phyllostomus discolor TaxID=89673 RepID=A0A834AHI3_9CHIR|nr:hypothetical protein HJG60_010724 [Phyllostomus discolor]